MLQVHPFNQARSKLYIPHSALSTVTVDNFEQVEGSDGKVSGCIMVSGEIRVQTLNHLGLIAGLVDEIGIVEEIDRKLGKHPKELVSAGQVVKAMIINGLGLCPHHCICLSDFLKGKRQNT
jgi:hypothetical protein